MISHTPRQGQFLAFIYYYTLIRAGRDFTENEPMFAAEVSFARRFRASFRY